MPCFRCFGLEKAMFRAAFFCYFGLGSGLGRGHFSDAAFAPLVVRLDGCRRVVGSATRLLHRWGFAGLWV